MEGYFLTAESVKEVGGMRDALYRFAKRLLLPWEELNNLPRDFLSIEEINNAPNNTIEIVYRGPFHTVNIIPMERALVSDYIGGFYRVRDKLNSETQARCNSPEIKEKCMIESELSSEQFAVGEIKFWSKLIVYGLIARESDFDLSDKSVVSVNIDFHFVMKIEEISEYAPEGV